MFNKVINIGILVSILCGIIYVIPNLFFINSKNFEGLPMVPTDAETLYLTKINKAYYGCTFNCNPYIKEYGYEFPHFDTSLQSVILAIPGIITGIPIVYLKVFYDFFLILILAFLIYFLIYRLTRNILISAIGGLYLVLGFNLLNITDLINIPDIINLLRFETDYTQFLIFSRPVNPQLSSIFFFIYLHVLLSVLNTKKIKWYILLAVTYGLLFYIYFFTYAFASVAQFVFIGIYFFKKDYKEFLKFSISTFAGLILAIPVFVQIIQLMNHKYYDSIPHSYLVYSHVPHISFISVVMLFVFIILCIFYYKKNRDFNSKSLFVGGLIIACFTTRNEHVVSGMIMQYGHFETYIFDPILIISICFLITVFIDKQVLYKYRIILLFIALLPIYNASLIQYNSYKHWQLHSKHIQSHVPILEWIKSSIQENSIISAPQSLSQYIPFYTNNYVLWTIYAGEWISKPDRINDITYSRTSQKALLEIGKKYNVDYYVEDTRDDLLKNTSLNIIYKDNLYIVYDVN